MKSGRPAISPHLHTRVDAYIKAHPELGFVSTTELIKALLRQWLEERAQGAPAEAVEARAAGRTT